MKFDIDASVKPPSFEFEYEIDRDEIRPWAATLRSCASRQ